jgi:hypothetical protein
MRLLTSKVCLRGRVRLPCKNKRGLCRAEVLTIPARLAAAPSSTLRAAASSYLDEHHLCPLEMDYRSVRVA